MRLSQAWMVARHDMGLIRQKRGVLAGLIAFPLGVALGFPALMLYIVEKNATAPVTTYLPPLIDAFSFWFVVAGASLPISIASYSIVGEKIEKSLEPLLATPTTDSEIFLGKTLAAFLPTILAIWAGSVLYQVLTNLVTAGPLGYYYYPNAEMVVVLFAAAPLSTLLAIEACVIISSRVTDVRSATQYAGVIFVPFIFLYIAGETGGFPLDATNLLLVSAVLAAVVVALFLVSRKTFGREEILTRWK